MKVILSQTLASKLKLLKGKMSVSEVIEPVHFTDSKGVSHSIPGSRYVLAVVDLSDHPDPEYDTEQCKRWMKIINTYFSTSYYAYRVDIGPFKAIYPTEVYENKIHFHAEEFEHKPTWRDWFIVEGDENAPQLTIELLSNVCNS